MDSIRIPKASAGEKISPSWIQTENTKGVKLRPEVRCNCGQITSIGNHHVHTDGRVTASYFHSEQMPGGCGWHVYIILDGYDGQEWKPGRDEAELNQMFE